jgi:hypothetical protein
MNDISILKNYLLCPSSINRQVVSMGPGATAGDLNAFSGLHNITTMSAFTATVSASGGYIIGGGMGEYSQLEWIILSSLLT